MKQNMRMELSTETPIEESESVQAIKGDAEQNPLPDRLHPRLPAQQQGLLAYIRSRRDYFAGKDLYNGWSDNQSGPCCEQCVLSDEHFNGRADALKAAAGCRNPFQVATHCQCHLPVRKAVRAGIVEAHNQLIRHFEQSVALANGQRT